MPRARNKDTPVRPYTKASDPRSMRAVFMVIDAELPVKLVALMHGFTPVALARKVSRARPTWPDDPDARARGQTLRREIIEAFSSLSPLALAAGDAGASPSSSSSAAAATAQAAARPQTLTKSLSRALARSLPAALTHAVTTALREALPDGLSLETIQSLAPTPSAVTAAAHAAVQDVVNAAQHDGDVESALTAASRVHAAGPRRPAIIRKAVLQTGGAAAPAPLPFDTPIPPIAPQIVELRTDAPPPPEPRVELSQPEQLAEASSVALAPSVVPVAPLPSAAPLLLAPTVAPLPPPPTAALPAATCDATTQEDAAPRSLDSAAPARSESE